MARLSIRWRWLVGLSAAALTGCLSPTLPMPPPGKPDIDGPDALGVVVLSGHAPPESLIYADNESTGYSFGQRANAVTGAYRFPILASVGDIISMFYRLDSEESMSIKFMIRHDNAKSQGAAAGAGGAIGNLGSSSVSAGSQGSSTEGPDAGAAGFVGAP